MGYYTRYKLSFDDWTAEGEKVVDELEAAGDDFLLQVYQGEAEETKWYDNETDMRKLSERHPEVLFKLEGVGEEGGDLWIRYFKNGKMQHCPAIITYDSFDESKLQ